MVSLKIIPLLLIIKVGIDHIETEIKTRIWSNPKTSSNFFSYNIAL